MKDIFYGYLKSVGITLFLILFGMLFCFLIKKHIQNHFLVIQYIRLFSASFIAISLFGRLGWTIQTWGGKSKPEKINNIIYKVLYGLGFFFLIISIFYNFSSFF